MADPTSPPGPARRGGLIVSVVLVVFALAVVRWATTPFDDWVPLDPPSVLPAGVAADALPKSAHFVCSSLFDEPTSATQTDQARSASEVQTLTRLPCASVRNERQVVTIVDLGLVIVGTLAFVVIRRRTRRGAASRPTAAVTV